MRGHGQGHRRHRRGLSPRASGVPRPVAAQAAPSPARGHGGIRALGPRSRHLRAVERGRRHAGRLGASLPGHRKPGPRLRLEPLRRGRQLRAGTAADRHRGRRHAAAASAGPGAAAALRAGRPLARRPACAAVRAPVSAGGRRRRDGGGHAPARPRAAEGPRGPAGQGAGQRALGAAAAVPPQPALRAGLDRRDRARSGGGGPVPARAAGRGARRPRAGPLADAARSGARAARAPGGAGGAVAAGPPGGGAPQRPLPAAHAARPGAGRAARGRPRGRVSP